MKKLLLLLTILCAAVVVDAHVTSVYTMQATQSTFTEINDRTIMDSDLNEPCENPKGYIRLREVIPATYSFRVLYNFPDDADHTLFIISESYFLTQSPQDGVFYAEGEELGGGTVLAYTTDTIYETPEDIKLKPSTEYYLHIYAAKSFCSNGPLYDAGILGSFNTKPAAPAAFEITEVGDETIRINLTANENNDNILVAYSTSLIRSEYGDQADIDKLIGQYSIGNYVGNGKVAYIGPAGEGIEITGLEHSKAYFFKAYSYDEEFNYSSETLDIDCATTAHVPYELDLSAVKTHEIPAGWTKNEGSSFELAKNVFGGSTEENEYLLGCQVTEGNATEGVLNQLTSCPIVIGENNAVVKFDFSIFHQPNSSSTEAYNVWNENDVFAVQVSIDGETFTDLASYNSTNNPQFVYSVEEKTLVPFEAELTQYKGQKIWIRLHWHLFNDTYSPGTLILDNFKVENLIIIPAPEVRVEEITQTSARVLWKSEHINHQFAYAKTGEEFIIFDLQLEGSKEVFLTDLEAETEYQVKVRGIVNEGKYSDWSEVVTFTTTAWPECDAPTNLAVQYVDQLVVLTWQGTEDHLLWELRYSEANSTSWVTIDSIESTTWVIEDLPKESLTYLWNVRALCTAGRVTDWSEQGTFTIGPSIPEAPVVTATASNDTVYLSWLPIHGATSYKVYYAQQCLGEFTETAVNITVPAAGTYCFTVTAVNELGESPQSEEACATVEADPDLEIPETPILEAQLASDSALLTWNAVELATYYNVYYITDEGDKLISALEGTEFKIKLSNPGEYCFYVTAVNLAGESEKSNTACVEYKGESIEEIASSLNIYPNPVQDKLYIEAETEVKEVVVYDVYGRHQVTETPSHQGNLAIDVTNLNSSVYFVKVVTENGETVKRFVKK